jgi:hypothetical protein
MAQAKRKPGVNSDLATDMPISAALEKTPVSPAEQPVAVASAGTATGAATAAATGIGPNSPARALQEELSHWASSGEQAASTLSTDDLKLPMAQRVLVICGASALLWSVILAGVSIFLPIW